MTALPRKASPRSRGALETNAQWGCGGSSTVVGQGRASTCTGFSISCIMVRAEGGFPVLADFTTMAVRSQRTRANLNHIPGAVWGFYIVTLTALHLYSSQYTHDAPTHGTRRRSGPQRYSTDSKSSTRRLGISICTWLALGVEAREAPPQRGLVLLGAECRLYTLRQVPVRSKYAACE